MPLAWVAMTVLLDQPLPAALNAWVETEGNLEWSAFDWFGSAAALISIVAGVGLLFFATWARHAYAASVVAITGATLFAGPSVSTALEMFFSEVTLLMDGFVIGVAYFSDARHYFEAKPHGNALQATREDAGA